MNILTSLLIKYRVVNKPFVTFMVLFIVMTNLTSCMAQNENDEKSAIKSEKYEPCCSPMSELSQEFYGINLFIPNVFTPNSDGTNDYFFPIFKKDSEIDFSILYFTIYDSEIPTKRRILFNREVFNSVDLKNYAFDGNYYKDNVKTKWEGQFWYSMTVFFPDKGAFDITGSACSVVCDEESAIFKDKIGCFFPAQVSSNFQGDNNLSNQEKDCFK